MLMQKIGELKMWKKRPFIFFTTVFFLLLLLLVIRMARPCQKFHFEGEHTFEKGVSTQNTVIYEGITLSPGVYQVLMNYETDTDMVALCNVADGTVFTGGLLSNGEHLYSGLEKTGYAMWLYEGTENLQVVVSYGGEGSLITGDLAIVETRGLWTMLFTIALFLGAVIYALMIFVYYDRAYAVSREKKHVFFWIAVISLIASVPYLCGYTIAGADLTYHMLRIEGVKDGLLGGKFPVRLDPRWVYDQGFACAIFYCNLFLYFPAVLRLLGFTISASYNIYCIALNIATAWIAFYCFGKMFGKNNIGLVCSALYTLSIYRCYKLLVLSNIGEGSAIAFLPLILYGWYCIFAENPEDKKYKTAWVPLMLGFAGLMQSHVLTCEMTVLVTFLFCLIHIRKVFQRNTFLELVKGALGSLLVSLWFVVPFLDYYLTQDVHIKHASGRTIQDRGLYLAQLLFHFWTLGGNVPLGSDMQYSHPIGAGLVLVAVLGVFLILWFSGVFRKDVSRRLSFVKKTALIGAVMLLLSMNIFPWDHIQFLNETTAALVSSLEFPYRFLGWGVVCLVAVFGYCLYYFEGKNIRLYWVLMAVAVIGGVMTSDLYLLDDVNRNQGYHELYNEEGMGFGYLSGGEYLIHGTDESRLTFVKAAASEGVEFYDYEKFYLNVTFACVNYTDEDGYVDIPLLLYKGYRAIDSAGRRLQVTFGENNRLRVLVPAHYEGNISIRFVSPFYWRVSEVISLATIVMLAVMGWRSRRRRTC